MAEAPPAVKDQELSPIRRTYEEVVLDGKALPQWKTNKLIIKGNSFILHEIRDGKEIAWESTISIDPTCNPKAYDQDCTYASRLSPPRFSGIYALDGDRLTLCNNNVAGKPRPQSFESPPGSKLMLSKLRRQRD
jgi:uncharacterized protein (TIGR03067 family)